MEKDVQGNADPVRLELGLTIAGTLSRFWIARGHFREGSDWFKLLLPLASFMRTSIYARALRAAGRVEFIGADLVTSRAYYAEALELARELKDDYALALALMGIGNALWESDYGDLALGPYTECLEIWTRLGHKSGIASACNNIGQVQMYKTPATALPNLERAVQLFRELGDTSYMALTLDSLGQVYLRLGDLAASEKCLLEALALSVQVDDEWNMAYDMLSVARLAAAKHNYIYSVRCLAAANACYDHFTGRLEKYDLLNYEECLRVNKAALGESAFEATWAEGLNTSPSEILEEFVTIASVAQQPPIKPAPASKPQSKSLSIQDAGLSTRETEVLILLAQGFSNGEIAEKLFLSLYTVNAHLRTIYKKLDVASRTAATRFAVESGLL